MDSVNFHLQDNFKNQIREKKTVSKITLPALEYCKDSRYSKKKSDSLALWYQQQTGTAVNTSFVH